jgi:hypothetical protein
VIGRPVGEAVADGRGLRRSSLEVMACDLALVVEPAWTAAVIGLTTIPAGLSVR